MNVKGLDQSRDLLLRSSRPLLVAHVDPDGDAVGSLLGLGWALLELGKKPLLACQDRLPRRFDFLPGFERVTRNPKGYCDLLVALDCSDPGRMGQIGSCPAAEDIPLLNVDHHMTNPEFGTINLVDAKAVSTTHILHRLLPRLGVPLDERIATCLLTGLVTDTQGFRTANVTADVLRVAVALMEAGAPLTAITQNGLGRRSPNTLRLWGAAFSRLGMADGIVWTSLPLAVQKATGCSSRGTSGLSNLLIGTEGACAGALFTEREDGQIDVGFRAVPGFDVAGVALALGGGGHALASGCLVPGPLEEAQQRVLAMLREELTRQRERASGGDGRHPQPR